jgi:hypothetical protein
MEGYLNGLTHSCRISVRPFCRLALRALGDRKFTVGFSQSCAEAIRERSIQFRQFVARPGEIDNDDGFQLGFGNGLSYAKTMQTSTARRK